MFSYFIFKFFTKFRQKLKRPLFLEVSVINDSVDIFIFHILTQLYFFKERIFSFININIIDLTLW